MITAEEVTTTDIDIVEAAEPKQEHGRDLTRGSIPRLLISFSMPLLLGNAIQAGYIIVNRIWVGQFLGSASLAAITNTLQVTFILIALANGLTLGANIVVSQYVGAKNWDGVRRVVSSSIVILGVLSLVLMACGQVLTLPLLRAIHTPPASFAQAATYMRLFLCAFPLMFLSILTTFLLRGVGDSVTPLIFQAIGVGITAILDPLFMLGWLGFPKLGLNGTAVAMLIAQTLCVVAFFVYLARKNHIIAPDWGHLSLHWPTVFTVMKIGLPAGVQQLLVAFGSAVMLFFVNRYGEAATAGFGAASQIDMVAFFIAMSFSMAIASLAGQNIGAQRPDRVRELFKWGMLLSGGMVLVITALALTVPSLLMSMFVNDRANPEAFYIGIGYLRIVGCAYITFAVMFVCIGIINGAGHTLVTTILSFIGLWGVRIPLAAYLSHHMHSVQGIWWAMATSFTVTMLLSLAYFFSGRWKSSVFAAGAGRRKFVAAEEVEMFG